MATRDVVAPLANVGNSNSLACPFTGTQPPKGDKIVVYFWGFSNSGTTVSSVKDNAASQNTYTAGPSSVDNTSGQWVFGYWLDLPSSASWSGNYTITVTLNETGLADFNVAAIAYGGLVAGAPVTNHNSGGSGTTATSGSVSPSGTSTYVAAVTDSTGANPATLTWAAPFTHQVGQNNGSAHQVGDVADDLNGSGSQNASVTIDNSGWDALIMAWSNAITNNPFKNPVSYMVQSTKGGRPARRRVGYWHTIADCCTRLIDYPNSQGFPLVTVMRSGKIGFRYLQPVDSLVLGLSATVPVSNSAGNMYQSIVSRRSTRRRTNQWRMQVSAVRTYVYSGTQNPANQIADVTIVSGVRGKRPRQRGGQAANTGYQFNTVYNDQVISNPSDRFWKNILRRSRAQEYPTSTFFAGLSQYVYPPTKKLAEWWVQGTKGGRPARRRVGFWHTVADSISTTLNPSGGTNPQNQNADTWVSTSYRRGRRGNRATSWYIDPGVTNTIFQDVVVSMPVDRQSRRTVQRFLNLDQSGARLGNWLNQPLRKLAEWWVQSSLYGRPARRRVGFWHTIADNNTTILQSERPTLGNYTTWVQSGKIRGRSRGPQQYQTGVVTNTVLQDQVASKVSDLFWRNRIRNSRSSDRQIGLLYTILSGFIPLRKLAEWWVQSTKGGRPARRRVGYWHTIADSSNVSLSALGELPARMIADVSVSSGRIRARRKAGMNWQTHNNTNTVYQDQVVSKSKGITWLRSAPSPAQVHNIPNKISYFVKFFVNLSTTSKIAVSVTPGLFRAIGAFTDAIIVQFRTFTVKLLNKIDRSK